MHSHRPCLAEYLLDFGPVVWGLDYIRPVSIVNTGLTSVKFDMGKRVFEKKGFTIDPRYLCRVGVSESVELRVSFNASVADLPLGVVCCPAVFNVSNVRLCY